MFKGVQRRQPHATSGLRASLVKVITAVAISGMLASCGSPSGDESTRLPVSETKPTTTSPTSTTTKRTDAPANGMISPYSGVTVQADVMQRRPLCVMIDNHPDARPQAALAEADMIFEMPVEGQYTRYMALFQSRMPERVGPIRSARDCFLDRMLEFNAIYTHFGASNLAEGRLASMDRLDGMRICGDGQAIERDDSTGKFAPHNAYGHASLLQKEAEDAGYAVKLDQAPQGYSFNRTATVPGEKDAAGLVELEINAQNSSLFRYDAAQSVYRLDKDDERVTDENSGLDLGITNVIVQRCAVYLHDDGVHRVVDQIGEGEGMYFSMGGAQKIRWSKADLNGLTRYTDADGHEISLNPGLTWVVVAPLEAELSFSALPDTTDQVTECAHCR